MEHQRKLYCYVDETGQDRRPVLVAIVVTGIERDQLVTEAERIEQLTGKRLAKWRKAAFLKREAYLRAILGSPLFAGALSYAQYHGTKAYLDLTVYATARAILQHAAADYKATVIVDGLRDGEIGRFAAGLRKLRIHIRKVRGNADESSALIRLADAVAGFLRDYSEGQPYAVALYRELRANRLLRALQ